MTINGVAWRHQMWFVGQADVAMQLMHSDRPEVAKQIAQDLLDELDEGTIDTAEKQPEFRRATAQMEAIVRYWG